MSQVIADTASTRGRSLWHDSGRNPPSLGCTRCPDLDTCGGLRIAAALYSCFDLCRCPPAACKLDAVCRRMPADFVQRLNEVGGFFLDNILRIQVPPKAPTLPDTIPMIYHGRRREKPFAPAAAALSLYDVVAWRDGGPRYPSASALRTAFGLAPDVPIVLSGTAADPAIERWWFHKAPRRRAAIAELRVASGDILVTTPNYSLFRDVPRWDDLHAMKRIAIAWYEFADGGIPAALHLNARTERDYERWARFISDRPEVTHVAFEFGTSAGRPGRREWHAAQLATLAQAVDRPLHLLVRGGISVLDGLAAAFARTTLLDTTAFMKTMMRRRLGQGVSATFVDSPSPTAPGAALDELLEANAMAVQAAALLAAAPRRPAPGHK